MTKVLFFITLSEIGGAQRYVLDVAKGAKNEGMEITVASSPNPWFQEQLDTLGISFREVKYLKRDVHPLSELRLFFELLRIIKSEKPDIIHLNSSKIGILGAIAGKLMKVPKVIFTAHGWVFNGHFPKWNKILIYISRFGALFQDKIICVSQYDRKKALQYGVAEKNKLVAIYNGIDINQMHFLSKKEAREKLDAPAHSTVIGTISNFYHVKSLKTIILSGISGAHLFSDITFVIIGDGPEKQNIQKLIAKYKLQKHFILPGTLQNAHTYLKAFDIFVLPSKKEGLPYALLEAVTAKIPSIVSNVGGMPEIIEHEKGGIVIDNINPTKLWDQIFQYMQHKKLTKEYAQYAFETVASKFTKETMIKKTIAIYEEKIKKSKKKNIRKKLSLWFHE